MYIYVCVSDRTRVVRYVLFWANCDSMNHDIRERERDCKFLCLRLFAVLLRERDIVCRLNLCDSNSYTAFPSRIAADDEMMKYLRSEIIQWIDRKSGKSIVLIKRIWRIYMLSQTILIFPSCDYVSKTLCKNRIPVCAWCANKTNCLSLVYNMCLSCVKYWFL